jgi:PAS domain S-box-containing protein
MHVSESEDFTTSFSAQRQRLLQSAAAILTGDAPLEAGPEAMGRLAQLLTAALATLKVAEDELVQERGRVETAQTTHERRLAHQQMLFDRAPAALLLTTTDSSIREANFAAAELLGVDRSQLEGKQLSAMTPRAQQAGFREQMGQLAGAGSVGSWTFTLEPMRRPPMSVTAAVEVLDDLTVGARALYWTLRPA